ncbi:hypothetical protein HOLDEFILI_01040 [Holdemania filiformis DSM 12042]|uniref:Uncharacterized protein n=1 Tax=Holdemania filiformis DSM 12042 TaxID=545696 RepID=B9Y5F8_9FIRM|nr:hypothetical protein HOLDEFILI_01040 [Holdemania filiformis DSM 12042]
MKVVFGLTDDILWTKEANCSRFRQISPAVYSFRDKEDYDKDRIRVKI